MRTEEESVVATKDDLVTRLQKQLEMKEKDIATLRQQNNESQTMLKSISSSLGKG